MKTLIIIVGLVLLGSGYFATTKITTTVNHTTDTANRALDLIERIEDVFGGTHNMEELIRFFEESKPILDSLLIIVNTNVDKLDEIDKAISSIPSYEIPDIDYIHPSTYEECLGELERVVEVNTELVTIIHQNQSHIALLDSKLDTQSTIIATQANIIEIQARDLEAISKQWSEIRQSIRRERIIGYAMIAGGIIIAIIF